MTRLINKVIAILVVIISIIFFSYRKGKKDLKSEQIKDLVKDYEVRKKADQKFGNRTITSNMRDRLRDKWSK